MISERELQQAIDNCMAEPMSYAKLEKLAVLFAVSDHLFADPPRMARETTDGNKITYDSGTEFSRAILGKNAKKVLAIVDDTMDAVKTLHPKMYDMVLDKIKNT